MKRASTNVDWVISLGIFLTYILFLFIFLKPGIHKVYQEESLFTLLEQNIYSEANHTLDIIPLYITSTGPGCFKVECEFPYDWDKSNTVIVDDNNQEIDYNLINGRDKIRFNFNFIDTGAILFFLHSNVETYNPPAGCIPTGKPAITTCELGTKETKRGLYNKSLQGLSGVNKDIEWNCKERENGYETLKEEWNFPLNKEFSLYTKEGMSYKNICNGENELNQTNVFVNEFKDILLYKYGDKTDILVNMRIW
jgi:hypothetical protein